MTNNTNLNATIEESSSTAPKTVIDWLLDSDPAIRWQVLRDLTGASPDDFGAERARVEHEGWGARLLALEERRTGCGGRRRLFPGVLYR